MTIRDLGYRAYEGELLPASHNTWVLLRHGMWRIWGSWINRLAVFGTVLPLLVIGGMAAIGDLSEGQMSIGAVFARPPAAWLRTLTGVQFWFVVTVVTLRSGAGVIAEDFTNRAYQFYFAKPVTPVQYLVGRSSALAIFVFALVFVPAMLLIVTLTGLGPEEQRLERAGLLLAALLDGAIIAISMSSLSIAVSALSKSRALTMMAWGGLIFIPTVLAMLVQGITRGSEWMWLGSPAGLLWVIGDALYKVQDGWTELRWYHAGPVLLALTVGGGYIAHYRIRQAEVIT
jgi:ABC-2 type transport system permease protein